MERLIIKHENGYLFKKPIGGYIDAVTEKLGQYEDLEEYLGQMFGGEVSLKDFVEALERFLTDKEKPDLLFTRILTYEDAEEWAEYKRLRDSGLLLKLPCKVGDTVWYADDDDDDYPLEFLLTSIEIKDGYNLYFAREKEGCETFGFIKEDVGKTVFLTKEEAEQALAKMKEV